jgi:mono/diheme cytochrome c family protein
MRQGAHVMKMIAAACAASLLAGLVGLAGQTRQPREDRNSGTNLYRIYCASCHGGGGKGDGPAAKTLRVPLPDLTTIAERRGGVYPSADIAQIVDGRRLLPGHTRGDMPRWGVVLGTMEMNNEAAVKDRVNALVTYLESLQSKQ